MDGQLTKDSKNLNDILKIVFKKIAFFSLAVVFLIALIQHIFLSHQLQSVACSQAESIIQRYKIQIARELFLNDTLSTHNIFDELILALSKNFSLSDAYISEPAQRVFLCEKTFFSLNIISPIDFADRHLKDIRLKIIFWPTIVSLAFIFGLTLLFILVLIFQFKKMSRKLYYQIIEPIKDISLNKDISHVKSLPEEVVIIQSNIQNLKNTLISEQQQRSLLEKDAALSSIALQVAHDIRSPVMALDALSQSMDESVNPKYRNLISSVSKRISYIANELVTKYHDNRTASSLHSSEKNYSLNEILSEVINEKSINLNNIKIKFNSTKKIFLTKNINPNELQRILSNILNNSIEANDKKFGLIEVSLYTEEKLNIIEIKDNGLGIAKDQLNQIFKKGMTSKKSGMGLGLTHAHEYLASVDGNVEVTSIEGFGTTVKLFLPTPN